MPHVGLPPRSCRGGCRKVRALQAQGNVVGVWATKIFFSRTHNIHTHTHFNLTTHIEA